MVGLAAGAPSRRATWPPSSAEVGLGSLRPTSAPLAADLRTTASPPVPGFFTPGLERTLAPLVTDTLIDITAVRPRTLAHVLAERLLPSAIEREVGGRTMRRRRAQRRGEDRQRRPALQPQRCGWAFSRRRRTFASRSRSSEPGERVVSVSALQGGALGSSSTCTTALRRRLACHPSSRPGAARAGTLRIRLDFSISAAPAPT